MSAIFVISSSISSPSSRPRLSTGNPEVKPNRVRSTRSLHSGGNKYRKSLSSRVMHVVMEVYLSLGRREKKEIRAGFTRR